MKGTMEEYLKPPYSGFMYRYRGDLPLCETWGVVELDGGTILDKSNTRAIREEFEAKLGPESADSKEPDGKWAVIYVYGSMYLAFEVKTPEGDVSDAVELWEEIEGALASYPVLDDDDFYAREREALEDSLGNVSWPSNVDWNIPDDWQEIVMREGSEFVDYEDGSPYLSNRSVWRIALEHGWLTCPECGKRLGKADLPNLDSGDVHTCPTLLEKLANPEPWLEN